MDTLKIIKNEYKQCIHLPVILLLLITVFNLCSLLVLKSKPDFVSTYMLVYSIINDLLICITLAYVLIKLARVVFNNLNIYLISKVNKSKVILSHSIIIFLIIFLFSFIAILEFSLIDLIFNNFDVQTFSLFKKPFLCWLQPVANGFLAVIFYFMILFVMPISKLNLRPFVKWMSIVLVTILLIIFQCTCASLFANLTNNLNFNNYFVDGNQYHYLMSSVFSIFGNQDASFLSINILHIGVLLWEIIFIVLCIAVYNIDFSKYNKKKQIISIISVVFSIIFLSMNIGIATYAIKKDDTLKKYTNNDSLEHIIIKEDESINIEDYVDLVDFKDSKKYSVVLIKNNIKIKVTNKNSIIDSNNFCYHFAIKNNYTNICEKMWQIEVLDEEEYEEYLENHGEL